MLRQQPIMLLAVFALALAAQPAAADEIGGSGFAVPQQQQDEWLWGVEGLARTPLDFSANVGIALFNYKQQNFAQHIDDPVFDINGNLDIANSTGVEGREGTLKFKPEAFQGGFRFSGGIGYWNCCVLIEPAIAFSAHHPFSGGDKRSTGRRAVDPSDDDEFSFAEATLKEGWDLVFGPLMTWKIREDIPVVGQYMGGLPVVFFPFIGLGRQDFDVELTRSDNGVIEGSDVTHRDFEDEVLVVGFDLDIPLPGAIGPFTHAFTFGFKWSDSDEKHDMFETFGSDPSDEIRRFEFQSLEGARYELRYTVYFNDFEGFFKRFIFGPAS